MIYKQIGIICVAGILFVLFIKKLLGLFGRQDIAIYFLVPVLAYCFGFSLRLSGVKSLVDTGYFFTDGAFLIMYSIFSVAFLVGQLKYWKK